MKFASGVTAIVFATALAATDSTFALGSAIVVAPSGPAVEPDGASAAAQAGMSTKDHAHKQATRAKDSQPAHRSAANAASGSATNMRHTP